mgnify:CR=1 FL=1
MKFTIKLIAAITLIVGLNANAGVFGFGNPGKVFDTANVTAAVAGCTNSLATGLSVTNTYDVSGGKDIAIQATFAAAAASTSNLTVNVYRSVDSSVYEPNAFTSLAVAATGTTQTSGITNVTVNAAQSVRVVVSTTALASAAITNATVKISVK